MCTYVWSNANVAATIDLRKFAHVRRPNMCEVLPTYQSENDVARET
jgi:hypothetical protein